MATSSSTRGHETESTTATERVYTGELTPRVYPDLFESDKNFDEAAWNKKASGPDVIGEVPNGWIMVDRDPFLFRVLD